MPFEIIFITEGRDDNPAAEIQFNGQRLYIVRLLASDAPQIEFLTGLYVGRDVKMVFPYSQLQEQIQLATSKLVSWQRGIASGRDVPPVLSSTAIWSPIPNETEIGREEAVYRRADHRLPA